MDQKQALHFLDNPIVQNVLILILIVGIGCILLRFATRAATIAGKRLGLSELAERPIRNVVFWVGVLFIVAAVLRQFQVDVINALTAVLGLVAIGFVAIWSILSHITSTFMLLVTRPFTVNDRIEFVAESIRGKVIKLTTVFTVLEDDEGGIFYVPNNFFFQKAIRRLPPDKSEPAPGKTIPGVVSEPAPTATK